MTTTNEAEPEDGEGTSLQATQAGGSIAYPLEMESRLTEMEELWEKLEEMLWDYGHMARGYLKDEDGVWHLNEK